MSNARSRKKIESNKSGPTFIGVGKEKSAKNKKRRKNLPLPRYVTFSDKATPESRANYLKLYIKQELELCKNKKYSRQSKGIQKPYRIHRMVKNLMD